jgi:hypothetical protein
MQGEIYENRVVGCYFERIPYRQSRVASERWKIVIVDDIAWKGELNG